MPDTGAPWNIPYVEAADLVSDWPADSLALANAIDAGLDAAGGLIEVKSAIFTGTQSASVAAADNVSVTSLSITHEVADAANKLIISAFIGAGANNISSSAVGIAIHDGTGLIAIGDAASSRSRVTAGGLAELDILGVTMPSVTFVHTPGAGSKTYTVRAINVSNATQTLYINRSSDDRNDGRAARAVSSLVIQEVRV